MFKKNKSELTNRRDTYEFLHDVTKRLKKVKELSEDKNEIFLLNQLIEKIDYSITGNKSIDSSVKKEITKKIDQLFQHDNWIEEWINGNTISKIKELEKILIKVL
jgi:hypothetical protein